MGFGALDSCPQPGSDPAAVSAGTVTLTDEQAACLCATSDALGTPADAPASILIDETVAPSTLIELQKAAKNLLMAINAALLPSTTGLGKSVDAAGGATDTGIAALAVRKDVVGVITPIDGDYTRLQTDSNGQLRTTVGNVSALSVDAGPTDATTLRTVTKGTGFDYSANLTVTNGAYTIGDVVGGLLTIANAVSANGKSSYIDQVELTGHAAALSWELWLLNADLATANVADNGVMAMVAADKPKVIAVIPLSSTDDFASPDATAVHSICARGIGAKVKAGAATTTIYGYLKAPAVTSPGTTAMTINISGSYCD